MTRLLTALVFAFLSLAWPAAAQEDENPEWEAIQDAAVRQTVYFHAWGGSEDINAYIAWVAGEVRRLGIVLEHVKITDASEVVSRVLTEREAGRLQDGAVDLVWINGENFAAMKREGLLLDEDWATSLPNYSLVDVEGKGLDTDFTVPTDGRESPWGTAQLTFYYDSAELSEPPASLDALAAWIHANPGRYTYAAPPNFIGTTFLKQVLYGVIEDPSVLTTPADRVDFDAITASLWAWLDDVQPDLWRSGRAFATDTSHLKQLMADNEISIAMTFNPGEASAAIRDEILPETVRSFVMDHGSLGNAHYVAIPFNAASVEAAKVVANFLLSAQAQGIKAREDIWGDPTVLDYAKLNRIGRFVFDSLDRGPATLTPEQLGAILPEPHPSWTEALEAEWSRRYSGG
jgi:putative thiamine transport system substrate-binding protein